MKISQAENIALSLSTMTDAKGVVGFKIARNLRMINDELKEYYQLKAELFRKYGEDKDGQLVIQKDSENYLLFRKEIEPILNTEVNFNFRMITEDELINSNLTSGQMSLLWDMVGEK